MAWSAITNAEIDPESPLTTGLFGKYRDNEEALYDAQLFARKAANTGPRGVGLVDDPHLTVTVLANATYMVEIILRCTTGGLGATLQYDFTQPAGCTVAVGYTAVDTSAGGGLGVADAYAGVHTGAATTINFSASAAVTDVPIILKGLLRTAVAGGAFTFQWDDPSATGVTLLIDSYMVLNQVYTTM